jgi:Flp pilus assembly protein TadG
VFVSQRAVRRSVRHRGEGDDPRGQSLVEFALVGPIFILMVIGVIEFAVAFNALLAVNFASRDAALLAAEAGSDAGADCVVLDSIEDDVMEPANRARISQVRIYWADTNGNPKPGNIHNQYNRGGSTTCTYPDGSTITVPYTLVTANYPETDRCDILAGCDVNHTTVDTIGVSISYFHGWVTPVAGLVSLTGTGFSFTHQNAMRMEPVL